MSDSPGIEGERGQSAVIKTRRVTMPQKAALYALGAGALIAFVFWKNPGHKEPVEEKATQTSIGALVQPDMMRQANPPAAEIQTAVARQVPPPQQPAPSMLPSFLPQQKEPHVRMLSYAAPKFPEAPTPGAGGAAGSAAAAGTSVAFKGAQIQGAKAGAALDQTLMLMPGIYHCTLDVAVSSDTAGPFMCHTSDEVRSRSGVVLMDRGTAIVGEYKSELRQGQSRLPSLAVTAWTPQGVPVPLNSPMADALGRVGMEGDVDHHYGERFGAAVLLLLTQGALGAAQSALSHGSNNNTTTLNLQGGGMESMVTETLRNTISIPPTITLNQGEDVAFFVTAPVDFSAAYEIRSAR